MKKIYPILFALIFINNINAQCPTFSLNMSTSVLTCNTTSITVTAVNTSTLTGVSYLWMPGSFNGNPFTVTAPGTYTVIASVITSTCVVSQTFAITSNTTPPSYSIVASSNQITCSVPVVTLSPMCTGTGTQCLVPVTYTWTSPTSATTTVSSPTYNAPGTYTLQVKSAFNGCIGIFTKAIGINTLAPSVTAANNSPICAGQTATLVASSSAGTTYSWSTGATTQVTTLTPTISANYTVWATSSANGCSGLATTFVSVSPCTGITVLESNNNIILYPNPSKGIINFKTDMTISNAEIVIFDMIGQEVFRKKVNSISDVIDVSGLAKGIYNYSIDQNKQHLNKGKFVLE